MNDQIEILTQAHNSLAVRWGTGVPFALGTPFLREVGFAHLKKLIVPVTCPEAKIGAMIPIARQRAYSYLGEHGMGPEALIDNGFGVRNVIVGKQDTGRQRVLFINENESADCGLGARKQGYPYTVEFEMTDAAARCGRIDWTPYTARWKDDR